MIIEIKVFSFLLDYASFSDGHMDGNKYEIPERTTVDEVLNKLNLPEKDRKNFLLLINGYHANTESVLNEGDVLHIAPPIPGG